MFNPRGFFSPSHLGRVALVSLFQGCDGGCFGLYVHLRTIGEVIKVQDCHPRRPVTYPTLEFLLCTGHTIWKKVLCYSSILAVLMTKHFWQMKLLLSKYSKLCFKHLLGKLTISCRYIMLLIEKFPFKQKVHDWLLLD